MAEITGFRSSIRLGSDVRHWRRFRNRFESLHLTLVVVLPFQRIALNDLDTRLLESDNSLDSRDTAPAITSAIHGASIFALNSSRVVGYPSDAFGEIN